MEVIDGVRPTKDAYYERDEYFDRYDVRRPDEVTEDDLPPTDDAAVRKLDYAALEEEKVGGKWHVSGTADTIESYWPHIVDDVDEQIIWGAKAMTATGFNAHPHDDYMIIVYTPNYFEKHDVDRVRNHLREKYDVTETLTYKPNIYSVKGIQPNTADEWGLSTIARFRN